MDTLVQEYQQLRKLTKEAAEKARMPGGVHVLWRQRSLHGMQRSRVGVVP